MYFLGEKVFLSTSRIAIFSAIMIFPWPLLAGVLSVGNAISGQGEIFAVIDGDTVVVTNINQGTFNKISAVSITSKQLKNINKKYHSIKIRIASINTPESANRDESKNTQAGRNASNYLKSWVKKGDVAKFDCYNQGDYGRLICTVKVNRRDIGYEMIRMGHSDYVTHWGKNPYYDTKYRSAVLSSNK